MTTAKFTPICNLDGVGQMSITYHKGPLGYAVSVNGRPVGAIRKIRSGGWLVSIEGFRPSKATQGQHHVKTIAAARTLVASKITL